MNSRERERAEGWGWIMASATFVAGWGIVASMGQDPSPGLAFGPFALGIWKVAVRGSGFRGWKIVRKEPK